MVARLIAVALAMVIAGVPVITSACQGVCAVRANDGGESAEQHSCHHQAPSSNRNTFVSTIHLCGHSDEGPSAVSQSLWSFAAPAVSVAIFALMPPVADAPQFRVVRAEHAPPGTSPLHAQLRI